MAKKKILIFSHEFPPFGGGAGVVAYQYYKTLSKLNHKVTLLTVESTNARELNNIEIITIPKVDKIWPLFYMKKLQKIDLTKFDFIFLNDIGAIYIAGLFFKDSVLSKAYTFLHGSEPETMYNNVKLFHKIMLYPKFYQRAINKSKNIIAVSKYMKEKFIEETKYNQVDKIKVCYAGLDDMFFTQNDIKNTEPKDKTCESLLTVSRIEKRKGFLNMYSIFKKLIHKDPNYKWIIIGDGSFKKEFEEIVKRESLDDKIVFLGSLPRNELIKYYYTADVFWLLSEYKESFGLVYLEAQACGCPAIGYDAFGVKEAILDTKTGFFVKEEDEVLNVLLTKSYKNLILSNHNDFIESFKTSRLINSLLDDI